MTASMDVQLSDQELASLLRSETGPVGVYLFATGKRVEGVAKRKTPVDTGRLRSSITTGVYRIAYDPYLACRVGTDVDYATYVHEGTRYVRGRPFLADAVREVTGQEVARRPRAFGGP